MNKHLNLNKPAKPAAPKPLELSPEQLHERIVAMAANKRVELAQALLAHYEINTYDTDEDITAIVEQAFKVADAFILKAYNVKFHADEEKKKAAEEPKETPKGKK